MPKPNVICVGFSVRALVEAAAEAGYRTSAIDAFGDFDTQIRSRDHLAIPHWGHVEHATVEILLFPNSDQSPPKMHSSPTSRCGEILPQSAAWHDEICSRVAASRSDTLILLAGGTENWPELISRMQHLRLLAGPSRAQVQLLRSPQQLQRWCDSACDSSRGLSPVDSPLPDARGLSTVDLGSFGTPMGLSSEASQFASAAPSLPSWGLTPAESQSSNSLLPTLSQSGPTPIRTSCDADQARDFEFPDSTGPSSPETQADVSEASCCASHLKAPGCTDFGHPTKCCDPNDRNSDCAVYQHPPIPPGPPKQIQTTWSTHATKTTSCRHSDLCSDPIATDPIATDPIANCPCAQPRQKRVAKTEGAVTPSPSEVAVTPLPFSSEVLSPLSTASASEAMCCDPTEPRFFGDSPNSSPSNSADAAKEKCSDPKYKSDPKHKSSASNARGCYPDSRENEDCSAAKHFESGRFKEINAPITDDAADIEFRCSTRFGMPLSSFCAPNCGSGRFGTEANCPSAVCTKRRWLVKSTRSCGGTQVRWLHPTHLMGLEEAENYFRSQSWCSSTDHEFQMREGLYIQAYVPGRILGITGLIAHADCRLLGVVESIQNKSDWLEPAKERSTLELGSPTNPYLLNSFSYAGSWGPVSFKQKSRNQSPNRIELLVLAFLETIGRETGIHGYLQFDVVEDDSGNLWLLEINPRWTAGMEVLLRSGLCNPVAEHLNQYLQIKVANSNSSSILTKPIPNAKVIYYLRRDAQLSSSQIKALQAARTPIVAEFPDLGTVETQLADIPSNDQVGTMIKANQPLVTILSRIISLDYKATIANNLQTREILQLATRNAARNIDQLLGEQNQ